MPIIIVTIIAFALRLILPTDVIATTVMMILSMEPGPIAEAQHVVRRAATTADVRAVQPRSAPGAAAGTVVGVKAECGLRRPQGCSLAAYATRQAAHLGAAVGEAFQEKVRAQ